MCVSSPPRTDDLEAEVTAPAASARTHISAWASFQSRYHLLRDPPADIGPRADHFVKRATTASNLNLHLAED